MLNVKNARCFMNTFFDVFFWEFAKFKTEGHIVVYAHMWIKRIILKDHGDIAIFRWNIVDQTFADVKLAFTNFFQPCDHSKCRRFTATRRPDEDDKFSVFNVKVDVVDSDEAVGIFFGDIFEYNACHKNHPFLE